MLPPVLPVLVPVPVPVSVPESVPVSVPVPVSASTPVEVFRMLPEPKAPPGNRAGYASTNYVLLGTIIEHVTGRPLAEVFDEAFEADSK